MHLWRLLLTLAIFVPLVAFGQVYKHIGPDGKVQYSDRPPTAGSGSTVVQPEIRSRPARPEDDPVTAAMNVYANETAVETFYRFCREVAPESEPALRDARDRWNARHATLSRKKITVMHDHFSVDQLRKIAAEMEATHLEILDKVRRAPLTERSAWCKAAPTRYEAPELNPSRNPALVKTLVSYQPKAARR